MYETVYSYSVFYRKYFVSRWEQLSPPEYAAILIVVAAVGYMCMRGKKRA